MIGKLLCQYAPVGRKPSFEFPFKPADEESDESRLRSAQDVYDYRVQASDGELGHVVDLVFDTSAWRIHYFIIDTGNWLPGRKVAMPPQWITDIRTRDWSTEVDAARDTLQNCPTIASDAVLSEAQVKEIRSHFEKN